MRPGDKLTIAGIHGMERNPDRRWWQLWKPRWLVMSELQCFEITGELHG